jgi:FHS family L-fucose permease-like MFS transporter
VGVVTDRVVTGRVVTGRVVTGRVVTGRVVTGRDLSLQIFSYFQHLKPIMYNQPNRSAAALPILISVFFFWGFVAASNDILIPVFKEKLNLEQWQSQMISFAFYVAYTVGSLIYYFLSKTTGGDILNRIGYKNGIALGLVISALGTLLFFPAAESSSFGLMISGLFIVGLGFSLQQTAANPLAITIGDPKKGAQRLSLAGGINNIGTTIGPIIVSFAIFGSLKAGEHLESLSAVKGPYLILGAAFVIVAIIFRFSSLPNQIHHEETVPSVQNKSAKKAGSALSYPQLWMGMIAIFLYVGVEVSTASNLPEFMRIHLNTPTNEIAPYVSLFWASLMIGRWTGAVGAFDLKKNTRTFLNFILPYAAFGVFLFANRIANNDLTPFYVYAFVIIIIIIADLLSKGNPARQLLIFSFCGITALLIGILSDGLTSVYAFISVGLFCSTLWPCIFTLAIAGLGKHTNEGSSFLIMMIMGGGFVSLLQGWLASDDLLGIQWSYIVGILCFAYLAFYGWKVQHILAARGIHYDTAKASH